MAMLTVIPTRSELEAFVQACREIGYTAERATVGKLAVASFPALAMVVAPGGLGKVQFAVQTQHLLDSGDWDLVVCAGAAGALVSGLSIGDVVVATETVEHDVWNKIGAPRLPRFGCSAAVLERCRRALASATGVITHYGRVASGDEDVVDDDRRAAIRDRTEAIVVAWEGAGGARACDFSGVPFVEIRGVTDSADGGAARDFKLNVERALRNVATVAVALARSDRDGR